MKTKFILILTLAFTILSCSSDDDSGSMSYAMTAQINGETFEANNPFENNEISSTNVFTYFPQEEFILLIGREGGTFGPKEIKIWLKKSDIAIGTYPIGSETFDTTPSHFIRFLDLTNDQGEYTKEGSLEITEVNTSTKTVTGTFELITTEDISFQDSPVNFTLSEGKFKYKYEEL